MSFERPYYDPTNIKTEPTITELNLVDVPSADLSDIIDADESLNNTHELSVDEVLAIDGLHGYSLTQRGEQRFTAGFHETDLAVESLCKRTA
jgi:hypothetical protein